MTIPKSMHQIWVGPLPAPESWLRTWREAHPTWTYTLWGNKELKTFNWKNKEHMEFYASLGKWNGVADLMRYEILYRHGGVVVAADSICTSPIDDLFEDGHELYTINTGQYEGGPFVLKNQGSTTPLYAAVPKHPFTRSLILKLHKSKMTLSPVKSTGNRFMQRMLRKHTPRIKIWPMHYFIPDHFNGWEYKGSDKTYARHFWGTSRGTYEKGI